MSVGKTESVCLVFTVKVDDRNRIQIPKDVATTARLSDGDTVSLVLSQVIHKEVG
jgi:hypothetical protein